MRDLKCRVAFLQTHLPHRVDFCNDLSYGVLRSTTYSDNSCKYRARSPYEMPQACRLGFCRMTLRAGSDVGIGTLRMTVVRNTNKAPCRRGSLGTSCPGSCSSPRLSNISIFFDQSPHPQHERGTVQTYRSVPENGHDGCTQQRESSGGEVIAPCSPMGRGFRPVWTNISGPKLNPELHVSCSRRQKWKLASRQN